MSDGQPPPQDHEQRTRALFRSIALERRGYYDSRPGEPARLSFWQRRIRKSVLGVLDGKLRDAAGVRLLDAGCGRGDLTAELALRYPAIEQAVGCDFSPELIELAQASVAPNGRIRFSVADVTNLPFESGAFDVTVCLNVLHHVRSERRDQALEELARVTRRVLLVEIKNADSPYFRLHSKRVEGVDVFPVTVGQVNAPLRALGFSPAGHRAIFGLQWLSPLVLLQFERDVSGRRSA